MADPCPSFDSLFPGVSGLVKASCGVQISQPKKSNLDRPDDCAYRQQRVSRKSFYSVRHRHRRRHRERFIELPLSMSGRACPPGPVPFNPAPDKLELRALFFPSTPSQVEARRPYEFSRRNWRSAQTVFGWERHFSKRASGRTTLRSSTQAVPSSTLAGGLAEAFRSGLTAPFPYAQHPVLIKTLGAAALTIAMKKMADSHAA